MRILAWGSFVCGAGGVIGRTGKAMVHGFSPVAVSRRRQPQPLRQSSSSQLFLLQVFDNVLSPTTCEKVHDWAVDHAHRRGSSIVRVPVPAEPHQQLHSSKAALDDGSRHTPLERILCELVQRTSTFVDVAAVRDGSRVDDAVVVIEYWSRTDYRNMDAHVDIDERQLENEGTLRCPAVSHVLYLVVDSDDRTNRTTTAATRLVAPTMVLHESNNGDSVAATPTATTTTTTTASAVSIVPAIPGRLLRFSGQWRHAVPKPHDRWLWRRRTTTEEEQELESSVLEHPDYSDDEYDEDYEFCDDDDDDMDESSPRVERSVLLFNTWIEQGPLDVQEDRNTMPDGIVVESDGDDDDGADQGLSVMEHDTTANFVQCNPRDTWVPTNLRSRRERNDTQQDSEVDKDHLRIKLMGTQKRREQKSKYLTFSVSPHFRNAISESHAVSTFDLSKLE